MPTVAQAQHPPSLRFLDLLPFPFYQQLTLNTNITIHTPTGAANNTAILKSLPGVEVTVEVDGEPLDECEDKTSTDKSDTATRYIEAQSDKTFEIRIVTAIGATRGPGLEYKIVVDGNTCDEVVITEDDAFEHDPYELVSYGWLLDQTSQLRYKFDRFRADEDGVYDPSRDIKKLGLIEVNVYHLSSVSKTDKLLNYSKLPAGVGDLSEKSTKGQSLTHTVGFGDTIEGLDHGYKVNVEYTSKDPIAYFKFLYRSREALKAELIIPRTPSPPPLEERDADSLGRNDITDLQKQVKAMKEKMEAMAKVKKEGDDDNPRPRKAARPSAGQEVIELD